MYPLVLVSLNCILLFIIINENFVSSSNSAIVTSVIHQPIRSIANTTKIKRSRKRINHDSSLPIIKIHTKKKKRKRKKNNTIKLKKTHLNEDDGNNTENIENKQLPINDDIGTVNAHNIDAKVLNSQQNKNSLASIKERKRKVLTTTPTKMKDRSSISPTQTTAMRRIQSEWKDIIRAGIAFDWIAGKPQDIKKKISKTNYNDNNQSDKNTNIRNHYLWLGPISKKIWWIWHFTFEGIPGSIYENGIYHGRITINPKTYPLTPPSIQVWTKSGRFIQKYDICLSTASNYHPELWEPASWNIKTIIDALRLHMLTKPNEVGGINTISEQRKIYAKNSRSDIIQFSIRGNDKNSKNKNNNNKILITIDHAKMIQNGWISSIQTDVQEQPVEESKNESIQLSSDIHQHVNDYLDTPKYDNEENDSEKFENTPLPVVVDNNEESCNKSSKQKLKSLSISINNDVKDKDALKIVKKKDKRKSNSEQTNVIRRQENSYQYPKHQHSRQQQLSTRIQPILTKMINMFCKIFFKKVQWILLGLFVLLSITLRRI